MHAGPGPGDRYHRREVRHRVGRGALCSPGTDDKCDAGSIEHRTDHRRTRQSGGPDFCDLGDAADQAFDAEGHTLQGSAYSCPFAGLSGNDDPETNKTEEPGRRADSLSRAAVRGDRRRGDDALGEGKDAVGVGQDGEGGRADRASMAKPYKGAALTVIRWNGRRRSQKRKQCA